jgi:hypothetical protein
MLYQEMPPPSTDDEDHDDDDDPEMGTSTRGMPIQLSNTNQLKTYDGCVICFWKATVWTNNGPLVTIVLLSFTNHVSSTIFPK